VFSICLEAMFRMLICWRFPAEIANLVSSIQVTSKALQMAGSLVLMTFTPPVRNVSIHDINLVLLRKKERLCNQITGCTITPNGKFICVDYGTKGLHILNEDWTSTR
jgi:hypothetical protein